jgi:hypothetical protein
MSWSKLHAEAMALADRANALLDYKQDAAALELFSIAAMREQEALRWLESCAPNKTRIIKITRDSLEALRAKSRGARREPVDKP